MKNKKKNLMKKIIAFIMAMALLGNQTVILNAAGEKDVAAVLEQEAGVTNTGGDGLIADDSGTEAASVQETEETASASEPEQTVDSDSSAETNAKDEAGTDAAVGGSKEETSAVAETETEMPTEEIVTATPTPEPTEAEERDPSIEEGEENSDAVEAVIDESASEEMPVGSISGDVFKQYITGMEFYELVNNAWVKVENGDFSSENAGEQVNGVKTSLSYTLPAGSLKTDQGVPGRSIQFKLDDLNMYSKANQSGTVYNGSTPVGTYSINKDTGNVVIVFDEDFAKINAESPVYGTLKFESKWKSSSTGDDSSFEITYGDETKITIWPDGIPGDVSAQKLFGENDYNPDTGEAIYTLKVTSQKGTSSPVKLIDNLAGFDSDPAMEVVSVVDQNNNPLSPGTGGYEVSDAGPEGVTVTLPAMSASSSYTVKVKATVPEGMRYDKKINMDNSLTATSTNKNGDEITGTGKVDYTYDNKRVLKSGYQDTTEDGKSIIRWKIEVNKQHADLTGTTLTDEMLSEAQELKITPANTGYTHTDKTDIITFTDINGKENRNNYVIEYFTYITDEAEIGKPLSQSNSAELKKEPDGPSQKDDITISYNVKWISKTGKYDFGTGKITWTIKVNEEGKNIAGAKLKDTMFKKLDASGLKITYGDGTTAAAGDYTITPGTDGKVSEITFNPVGDTGKNNNTYTITYATDVTQADKNQQTPIVHNEGKLEKGDGSVGTGDIGVNVGEPDIAKYGYYNDSNKAIEWTITLNSGFADLTDKTFTDTFEELKDEELVSGGTVKIFSPNDQHTRFRETSIILDSTVPSGEFRENVVSQDTYQVRVSDIAGIVAYVNDFWTNAKQDDKYKTCKYEIKYWTKVEKLGATTITNKAKLGEKEVEAKVEVDVKPDKVFQDVEYLTTEELANYPTLAGKNPSDIRRLKWGAKLPILRDGIKSGTQYYDFPDKGQWFSVTELTKDGMIGNEIKIGNGDTPEKILKQGEDYILYLSSEGSANPNDTTMDWVELNKADKNAKYNAFKIKLLKDIDEKYFYDNLNLNYTTLMDISDPVTEQYLDGGGNIVVSNKLQILDVSGGGEDTDNREIKDSFSKSFSGTTQKVDNVDYAQSTGLKWKLNFDVVDGMVGKEITIVDTLPKGVSITEEDTITFSMRDQKGTVTMNWKETAEGEFAGTAAIPIDTNKFLLFRVTYKDGKITIVIPEKNSGYLPKEDRCIIEYTASNVADSVFDGNGKGDIVNKATLSYDGKDKDVEDTQHIVKVEPEEEHIEKQALFSDVKYSDRTYIPYRVLINQGAKDLVEGKDTISMKDTLSYPIDAVWNYTVELQTQTVKLYYGETLEDGSVVKSGLVPNELWGFSISEDRRWNDSGVDTKYHYINLEIPDSSFLILEYTYAIGAEAKGSQSGDVKPSLKIANKAELTGVKNGKNDSEDEEEYEIHKSEATADAHKVMFYKIRKGAINNVLQGAVFNLYEWDKENKKWKVVPDETDPEKKKPKNIISGEDGKLNFDGFAFYDGTPYYLVETKAPDGYLLDTSHYHFYVGDSERVFKDVTCETCGGGFEMKHIVRDTISYIENETIPQTRVTVNKEWKDLHGKDITPGQNEVKVQLYQVKGKPIASDSKMVTVKFKSDDDSKTKTYSVPDGSWIELTAKAVNWQNANSDFQILVENQLGSSQKPDVISVIVNKDNKKEKTYRIAISGNTTISINNTQNCGGIDVAEYRVYCGYNSENGSGMPYGEPVTLSNKNDWSYLWRMLPEYVLNENNEKCPYFYYVKEVSATEGYLVKYTYFNPVTGRFEMSQVLPAASITGDFTITNIKEEKTNISVQKRWSDKNDELNSENWVDLQLYKSTSDKFYPTDSPRNIKVNHGGAKNLIDTDIECENAYIKVKFKADDEIWSDDVTKEKFLASNIPGMTLEYVTTTEPDDSGFKYVIYNIYNIPDNGCTLTVYGNAKPENAGNTVEIGLYSDANAKLVAVDDPVRISGDEWKKQWDNLPKIDEEGHELFYYVQEVGSSVDGRGYTQKTKYTVENNNTLVEITNEAPPKKEITVNKEWANDQIKGDGVTVQLYQYTKENSGKGDYKNKISLKYNNGGATAFLNGSQDSQTVCSDSANIWIAAVDYEDFTDSKIVCTNSEKQIEAGIVACIPKGDSRCPNPDYKYYVYNVSGLVDNALYSFEFSYIDSNGNKNTWLQKWDSCFVYEGLYSDSTVNEDELIPVPGEEFTFTLNAESNWTHTWSNLPSYENGKELFYCVKELSVSGDDQHFYKPEYIETTDANGNPVVTIKNTPIEEFTKVTAIKKWEGYIDANGNTINPNYEVTLQLKCNDELVPGKTATVNSDNWSCSWENLPAKTDGKLNHYSVEEISVKDLSQSPPTDVTDYTVAKPSTGVVSGDTFEVILTNQKKVDQTSITVEKEWDDGISDHSDYTVKAQLYKIVDGKATPVGVPVALENKDGKLTYTWKAEKGPEYYVVETLVKKGSADVLGSYTVTYTNDPSGNPVQDPKEVSIPQGTITIKNTGEPTSVSVKKKWVGADGTQISDTTNLPNIKVQLWKKGDNGSEDQLVEERELGSAYFGTAGYGDAGWSYNWNELPKGTYYVKEEPSALGYSKVTYQLEATGGAVQLKASETASKAATDAGTITITNYKDSTDFAVEKIWADNNLTGKPDVKVKLYRSTSPAVAVATPEPTVSPDPTNIPTPEPTPTGDKIKISVRWIEKTSNKETEAPNLGGNQYIEVNVCSSVDWQPINAVPIRLTAPNWSAEVDCPNTSKDITYYLENFKYSDKIAYVYKNKVDDIKGSGTLVMHAEYYSSNVQQANIQSISILSSSTKENQRTIFDIAPTTVSALTAQTLLESASAEETQEDVIISVNGTEMKIPNAEYMGASMDKTLTSPNGLTATWSKLDKTDANGKLYYYYAVEEPVDGYTDGYEITYKNNPEADGTEKVVITNIKDNSVTVKKNWEGELDEGASYEANVTLYKDGIAMEGPEYTVTLTNAEDTHKWTNLPDGTYYVKENWAKVNGEEVTNCTTTYQAGNGNGVSAPENATLESGTITITNTIERAGILLPGTGSKYSIYYYEFGFAFLLASAVWMAHTLRRRKIKIPTQRDVTDHR